MSSIPALSITPAIASAEATSEEVIMMLPLPRRVAFATALASRSIWNIRPLNFSTDQRPLESVSRSKIPVAVVLCWAPVCAPK